MICEAISSRLVFKVSDGSLSFAIFLFNLPIALSAESISELKESIAVDLLSSRSSLLSENLFSTPPFLKMPAFSNSFCSSLFKDSFSLLISFKVIL